MKTLALSALLMTLSINYSFAQIIDERGVNQQWNTDLGSTEIPLNELMALLPRDKIKPIDEPSFYNVEVGATFYSEKEPVIAVEYKGMAKAYPLSILLAHEIVNDEISGLKIAATFCPLCYSALVFNRTFTFKGETKELTFGTSGMLRNSDLVMWDRQTESWWQQFTGQGLVGFYSGALLEIVNSELIPFGRFRELYPEGQVLAPPKDHTYDYGTNPYVDYDENQEEQPFLYKNTPDSRLPATERVVGIYGENGVKAYSWTNIQKEKVINDVFENESVVLFYSEGMVSVVDEAVISESRDIGSVSVFSPVVGKKTLEFEPNVNGTFKDNETESVWDNLGKCIEGKYKGKELKPIIHGQHFAFAWLAFYPNTELYEVY